MSAPLSLALSRLLSSLDKASPTHTQLSAFVASLTLKAPAPAALLSAFPSATILSLLASCNSPTLRLISALLQVVRTELDRCWNATTAPGASRWGIGKAAAGERWERVLEEVVVGIKLFVRGSDDRVVSDDEKVSLGLALFAPLAALLSIPPLRLMIKRRVMDVFEYSTEHSPKNYSHLAQNATLGPAVLATILYEAKDQPLTERALELAFRLGLHVAVDKPNLRTTWAEHVFPESLWVDGEAKKQVRKQLLSMNSRSFAEDSKRLLSVLSNRASTCYRLLPTLTLSANAHPFTNSDSVFLSHSRNITYGHPVAFGTDSFTAIVTGAPPTSFATADDDDAPTEQILESPYSALERVVLSIKTTTGRISVRLVLLRAPALDSVQLDRGGSLEEDEIVFEVEGSMRARLEGVLFERGLSFETIDNTLPTPESAPKKAEATNTRSISPVSASDSDLPLAQIENIPAGAKSPAAKAGAAKRETAIASPPPNQASNSPTPCAKKPTRVPPASVAAARQLTKPAARKSFPNPAPAPKPDLRKTRASEPAGRKRGSAESEDSASLTKKARKSKVAFAEEAPTIIARPATLALESDPANDFSFSNYQAHLPNNNLEAHDTSTDFSFSNYAPEHDSDDSEGADSADSALKILEAKVAGMSRKQRKGIMEIFASQIFEAQDGGDEADIEPDVQMEDASPERPVELDKLPVPIPAIAVTVPSPAIVVPTLPKLAKVTTSHRRLKSHRPSKSFIAPIAKAARRSPKKRRMEYSDPADAELATVLHDLSDVFMKQFAIRRTVAHQAFDSSRLAIDRAARKVTKSLLQDSADLLDAAHKALEWPEKSTRLEEVVKAYRATVASAREERAKA